MNSRNIFLLLTVFVVFVSGSLAVTAVPGEENNYKSQVTEFGYYKKVTELERERNLAATSGYVRTGGDVELDTQTSVIPLKLNRLFGFKFRIEGFDGKDAVQLKLVVKHPVITRPNGSTSNGYSYPIILEVKNGVIDNHSGYSIDHDYEMVEGDWTFEYWYNDHKLLSKSFTTVKDGAENIAPQQEEQLPEDQPQEKQSKSENSINENSIVEPSQNSAGSQS